MKVLFYIAAGGRSLRMPNLGIGVVATPLLDYCEVQVIDRSCELSTADGYGTPQPAADYIEKETDLICQGDFDFVCMQVHSGNLLTTLRTLKLLKKSKVNSRVLIGGPSANLVYRLFSSLRLADCFFFGESSDTLFEFIVKRNDSPKNMLRPGAHFASSPYIKPTRVWPYPNFKNLYPNSGYAFMPFLLSTGCVFNCRFCTSRRDILGFGVHQDPKHEFLKFLNKYHPCFVRFNDSSFNGYRPLFRSALEFLSTGANNVQWGAYMALASLRVDDIPLLKNAGCAYVYVGLESSDYAIRAAQRKPFDLTASSQLLASLANAGIKTLLSVIVGLPGEDMETLRRTEDYIYEVAPTAVHVFTYEERGDLTTLYPEDDFWRAVYGRSSLQHLVPQNSRGGLPWEKAVDETLRLRRRFAKDGILSGEGELLNSLFPSTHALSTDGILVQKDNI